jgi:hypothetical protein
MNRFFRLSSDTSILEKRLSVPIIDTFKNVGLVGFYTTFLTPNVTIRNNKLHYEEPASLDRIISPETIVIPPGQYNLENLERYIQRQAPLIRVILVLKQIKF